MKLRLWVKRLIVAVGLGDRLVEFCEVCGRRQPLVWWSSDALWLQLNGRVNGAVCPTCFDCEAERQGMILRWVPEVYHVRVELPK